VCFDALNDSAHTEIEVDEINEYENSIASQKGNTDGGSYDHKQ